MSPLPRLLLTALLALSTARAQFPQLSPEQLQEALKRFPAADANHDGVLTQEEAVAFMSAQMQRRAAAPSRSVAAAPTVADAAYGPHARNVLDFWQAPAATAEHPAPVVVYIHGGGFISGDKSSIRRQQIVQQALDAGVSFAAINYRYLGPDTSLPDLLHDCARALQYLRSQSSTWHIEKTRIASYGESGGAGASLWLAFHPDLADPKNADPILRESTRLACVGANSTQFSYDFLRWSEIFGEDLTKRFGDFYTPRLLYGLADSDALKTDEGKKIRTDCDMLGLLSKDAPPVFLSSNLPDTEITNQHQFLHHPRHAQLIYDRCHELGVPVVASIPAFSISPPRDGPRTLPQFLFQHLKAP